MHADTTKLPLTLKTYTCKMSCQILAQIQTQLCVFEQIPK